MFPSNEYIPVHVACRTGEGTYIPSNTSNESNQPLHFYSYKSLAATLRQFKGRVQLCALASVRIESSNI